MGSHACMATSAFQGAFLNKQAVEERVIAVIKSMPSSPRVVDPAAQFVSDLRFDSLHRKDLFEKLSKEFCVSIPKEKEEAIVSVPTAVQYFASHPKARWGPSPKDNENVFR